MDLALSRLLLLLFPAAVVAIESNGLPQLSAANYSGFPSAPARLDPCAGGLRGLYRFGPSVSDSVVPLEDDNYISVPLGQWPIRFFGGSYSSLYVNNNGCLSFSIGVPGYIPQPFPQSRGAGGNPVIAPFWADVDTRMDAGAVGNLTRNRVYYRVRSGAQIAPADAAQLRDDVAAIFPAETDFTARVMVVATWFAVGYYQQAVDKLNTFQTVVGSDEVGRTYSLLCYDNLLWTFGSASQGTHANAGFDAGDGVNYLSLRGSFSSNVLNLTCAARAQSTRPGCFGFRIDNVTIQPASASGTPSRPPTPSCSPPPPSRTASASATGTHVPSPSASAIAVISPGAAWPQTGFDGERSMRSERLSGPFGRDRQQTLQAGYGRPGLLWARRASDFPAATFSARVGPNSTLRGMRRILQAPSLTTSDDERIVSGPVVDSFGRAVVITLQSRLLAIDGLSGSQPRVLWQSSLSASNNISSGSGSDNSNSNSNSSAIVINACVMIGTDGSVIVSAASLRFTAASVISAALLVSSFNGSEGRLQWAINRQLSAEVVNAISFGRSSVVNEGILSNLSITGCPFRGGGVDPRINGLIYVPVTGGVVAINAISGEAIWQWSDATATVVPITVLDERAGAIYAIFCSSIGIGGSSVVTLDAAVGSARWSAPSLQALYASVGLSQPVGCPLSAHLHPPVNGSSSGGILYLLYATAATAVRILSVQPDIAQILWVRYTPSAAITAALTVEGALLFASASSASVTAINRDGAVVWNQALFPPASPSHVPLPSQHATGTSSITATPSASPAPSFSTSSTCVSVSLAIGSDGTAYAHCMTNGSAGTNAGDNSIVAAFNATDGRRVFTFTSNVVASAVMPLGSTVNDADIAIASEALLLLRTRDIVLAVGEDYTGGSGGGLILPIAWAAIAPTALIAGAISAAIIGGAAMLACCFFFFFSGRRRKRKGEKEAQPSSEKAVVSPLTLAMASPDRGRARVNAVTGRLTHSVRLRAASTPLTQQQRTSGYFHWYAQPTAQEHDQDAAPATENATANPLSPASIAAAVRQSLAMTAPQPSVRATVASSHSNAAVLSSDGHHRASLRRLDSDRSVGYVNPMSALRASQQLSPAARESLRASQRQIALSQRMLPTQPSEADAAAAAADQPLTAAHPNSKGPSPWRERQRAQQSAAKAAKQGIDVPPQLIGEYQYNYYGLQRVAVKKGGGGAGKGANAFGGAWAGMAQHPSSPSSALNHRASSMRRASVRARSEGAAQPAGGISGHRASNRALQLK